MNNKCVFCDIISGNAPSHIVNDDDHTLTFLDKRPLFPGHCLLVPKQHYITLPDLPDHLLVPIFHNAKILSAAIKNALEAEGTFVAINNTVSQSVPHLHVHVVPRTKGDGLKGFFWPRNNYRDKDHLLAVANKLRQEISRVKKS